MNEWKRIRLGDHAETFAGGTPDRSNATFFGGLIPWVKSTEVNLGRIKKTEEFLTEEGLHFSAAKWIPARTVLVAMYGATAAQIAYLEIAATANQAVLAIVPDERIDSVFLFYALTAIKEKILFQAQGSGQPNLNKQIIDRVTVDLPPIFEQRPIAEILSTLDEAIEQTEALIAKHQQIKAGLMHDLFTRGVTPDGHLRPAREQAPDLYKPSPLGWIPKEWEVVRIADAFDIQLGKMLNKLAKTGKLSAPYLGNRAVQWDYVDCSAVEEMDFTPSERQKFMLLPDDLLVCEGGDVGRTAMWRGEIEGCYYQKAIHRLRPKSFGALPSFMLRFMRFARDCGYFREFTSQSSIAHLTQEKLGSIGMQLPPSDEQQRISDRLDAHDDVLQAEQLKLAKLRQQKRGLMHDLLTGHVRVKVNEKAEVHSESTCFV